MAEKGPIDDDWKRDRRGAYDARLIDDQVWVYRALEKLTDGEAKKVILSVKDEDGFRAWQKMRIRFEPTLVAKQGALLAEYGGMVAKPATNPGVLVAMMADMDKKVEMITTVLHGWFVNILTQRVI